MSELAEAAEKERQDGKPSAQPTHAPLQSHTAQGVELLESFDNFAKLRNALRDIAKERGLWAGIPMPMDDARLVLNPKYPYADVLSKLGKAATSDDKALAQQETDGVKLRNVFYSHKLKSDVVIYEEKGKLQWAPVPRVHHFNQDLLTLGCSHAWGIEQEHKAIMLLGELLPHHALKMYLLTGMFLETSKRSNITYVFRKLRPTVALREDKEGDLKILCCLCLHTLGYYQDSWAGALTPTDDVISHLLLMRADEHRFWKESNQHPPWLPNAGL